MHIVIFIYESYLKWQKRALHYHAPSELYVKQ